MKTYWKSSNTISNTMRLKIIFKYNINTIPNLSDGPEDGEIALRLLHRGVVLLPHRELAYTQISCI